MILTAHQPAYLPWLGYFDKIIRSDIYVFLDSVQYEVRSFINRNKIKSSSGGFWLTVPVKARGHREIALKDIEIDNEQNWKQKHLHSIYLNYKKAPRFAKCYAKLEVIYQKDFQYLADLCLEHLIFWLKELGVEKTIVRSSQLPINSKKSNLILDLCNYFNAKHYISGTLGKNYLKEEEFQRAGVFLEYQNYQHPVYPQLWGEFLPYMSIVDFWMNTDQYWLITGGDKDEFFKRMGRKIPG